MTENAETVFTGLGQEVLSCPSWIGGKNWEAGAYSPLTNTMYYPLRNTCARVLSTMDGGLAIYRLAARFQLAPGTDQLGTVRAISAETGRTMWIHEQRAGTMSLVATGGDPDAIKLFETALAKRASWSGFPGFTAGIVGTVDGRAYGGTARVAADGTVSLDIDEKHAAEWVKDQLGSIVRHRRAPSGQRAAAVLRFADDDLEHPLGRLMTFVGGSMASSYRVHEGQISVVNRAIGPQHMTITVLDNQKNVDGKFLPRSYSVQYWDGKTGKLVKTQSFQNRWTRVGRFDLPTRLTVTTASGTGLNVRSLRLAKHKLLPAAK